LYSQPRGRKTRRAYRAFDGRGAVGPNKERQEGRTLTGSGSPRAIDSRTWPIWVSTVSWSTTLTPPKHARPRDAPSLDTKAGAAKPNDAFSVVLSPGTGPRHVAFSPDGNFMYVLGELQSTVTVFANDARVTNRQLQRISALPEGFSGRNDAAEIALHPSGRWLFTSNRGHDTIAVFAVDPHEGTLRKTGDFPTGGKEPRHFAIDPTGISCSPKTSTPIPLWCSASTPATGALTQVSKTEGIPSPVCLVFLQRANFGAGRVFKPGATLAPFNSREDR